MSGNYKAVAVVAHPDDCIIFAKPFIDTTPVDWTVCYLTYNQFHPRSKEVRKYWSNRNIETVFLGYADNHRDIETGELSFDVTRAAKDINQIIDQFDLILTHDVYGDYGHPHHVFIHSVIKDSLVPKVYFANRDDSNFICTGNGVDLTQLPLHQSVIKEFEDVNTGRYFVSKEVLTLLESYGKS